MMNACVSFFLFFFFKQQTAYEMRISDWSSDVCSSDLCRVGLYTAASTSERISFHTLNRATGHRVSRQYVDQETGKPVERDDQVKGYETGHGDYIVLEPEEVAAAIPESDKTLEIEAFIPCAEVDDVSFDKPYSLTPPDRVAENPKP